MWSWNLDNGEALAHPWLLRHEKNEGEITWRDQLKQQNTDAFLCITLYIIFIYYIWDSVEALDFFAYRKSGHYNKTILRIHKILLQ